MPCACSSMRMRRPSAASRAWVLCCQALSRSAALASSCAGPLTAQGPSSSARACRIAGSAPAKPSRSPASPKNLPTERSTTRPGCPAWDAMERSGAVSPKASSTISHPPRAPSRAAQSSNCAGGTISPVGLLGLTTTITSLSSIASASSGYRASRSVCPCCPQACACSAYEGAETVTRAGARRRGRAWIAAWVPATGSRSGAPYHAQAAATSSGSGSGSRCQASGGSAGAG